jgi:Ca2+-transporting ATPase
MWRRLLDQFSDPLVLVLIAAALLAGAVGEWGDTIAIVAIVLLNGAIGFIQQDRAERAIAALRKLSAPMARVIRDGSLSQIPAIEVCPGDILALEAGDTVPADARLLESAVLSMQEAALTGESTAVDKDAAAILFPATPLAERRNMVFLGTNVSSGRAQAVVVAIGMQTELGRIAGLLARQQSEPTPLQRRLKDLGRLLLILCLALAAVIFLIHCLAGAAWQTTLVFAVSLAVAAVPEGLPAVVTIALAIGVRSMARRNALIRKLPSVETLGSVTVVCTDKTGTLTRNEMTVRRVALDDRIFPISGASHAHQRDFTPPTPPEDRPAATGPAPDLQIFADAELRWLLTIGAGCNHAQLVASGGDSSPRLIGDPTERALLIAALDAEIDSRELQRTISDELPFDSERKLMSVVLALGGKRYLFTKGAPESVLGRCEAERHPGRIERLTNERRDQILQCAHAFAADALRVLGLAYRELPPDSKAPLVEDRLVFAGLIGMADPPRAEARPAVELCRQAGVRPIMITGDHPATARAIGRELALLENDDQLCTGAELDRISDEQLGSNVGRISVYARATAEHKLRIVHALKRSGEIVGMIGDGVNDAPALKAADIGVAMGLTGVDVVREASDIVLTDDSFATIVAAIREGRGVYDNIRKVLRYLLACNTGEVAFVFGSTLAGWPIPLDAVQLLWINLVTDGPPALALVMERPERDIMDRPPRRPDTSVISRRGWAIILAHGLLVAAVTAVAFGLGLRLHDQQTAKTLAFCVLAYSQLFYAFACRSTRRTLFSSLFGNPALLIGIGFSIVLQTSAVLAPGLREVFESSVLSPAQWILVLLLSLVPVTVAELSKLLVRRTKSA